MEATLTPKPSYGPRVNVRLIVLLSLVAAPFLWVAYMVVDQLVNHGVRDRGSYVEVDLKSLGNFAFNPVTDTLDAVPNEFRKLDGKRVVLEGEMFAPNEASDDVRQFELVYNIQKCCFGGPPKVQERVFARVPDGKHDVPNFQYAGIVRVTGTLHVRLRKGVDGAAVALYEMDVEHVESV